MAASTYDTEKILKKLLEAQAEGRDAIAETLTEIFGRIGPEQQQTLESLAEERKRLLEAYSGDYSKYLEDLERAREAVLDAMETSDEAAQKAAINHFKNLSKLGDKIKEVDKAYSDLDKKLAEHRGFKGFSNEVNRLSHNTRTIVSAFKNLADPWAKADQAASKYVKTIGMAAAGMEALRRRTIDNVSRNNIGIDFNMSTDELLKAQESYMKGVGRNLMLSDEDQRNMAAMAAVYGDMGSHLAVLMEQFGVSMTGSADHLGKMFKEASKSGVSLEKYAQNVQEGLRLAQTYTFTGGLKSMERMAQRAAAVKMDMQQVQRMADSFGTVENAITNAAKLQVLGGSFATNADPLGMLRESLMDPEALQQRMERIVGGMGHFNRATGEVEIGAFNRQRLKAYADATGQDIQQVMRQAQQQAKRGEIMAQIGSSANAAGWSKEFKEMVANTATFKEGKAGVSINGQWKSLSELKGTETEELIKETQSEAEDIKDIARSVRSITDLTQGFNKQKDSWLASAFEHSFIGPGLKHIIAFFGSIQPFVAATAVATTLMATHSIATGWQKGGGFWKNLTGIGKGKAPAGGAGGAGSTVVNGTNTATRAGRAWTGTSNIWGSRTASGLKLTKFAKGTSILAGIGAGIATGAEEFGGDNNHRGARKVGSTAGSALGGFGGALGGAAIGTLIGGPVGTVVGLLAGGALAAGGSQIGKWAGSGFANDQRRERFKQQFGLDVNGDYRVSELKEMDRAVKTGIMSNSLRRRMQDAGDTDMIAKIDAVKEEKGSSRYAAEKSKFGTASFEVGTAYFNTRSYVSPKAESGESAGFSKVSEDAKRTTGAKEPSTEKIGPIDININGTLKLEGKNGESVDLIDEIKHNDTLKKEILKLVETELNSRSNGGYKNTNQLNGFNMPR